MYLHRQYHICYKDMRASEHSVKMPMRNQITIKSRLESITLQLSRHSRAGSLLRTWNPWLRKS